MTTVQVKNEQGNLVGRIPVGEQVSVSLRRVRNIVGAGGLCNKDGVVLLDEEFITAEGAPYVFKQNQQPMATNAVQQPWWLVEGTVERSTTASGVRYRLIQHALCGYYPEGKHVDGAFHAQTHPTEGDKRLICISVVFSDRKSAETFVAKVDNYLTENYGLCYYQDAGRDGHFKITQTCPFEQAGMVLTSDYTPCEADGEAPNDFPVWDVAYMSVSLSGSSVPTKYGKDATVFKYQRIEEVGAFDRAQPQGAHIFPKAHCKGKYEWLDKQMFNRLALSPDGHEQFDGTAHGSGARAETVSQVTVEPVKTTKRDLDGKSFAMIECRLWCRNQEVATNWRRYLPDNLKLQKSDDYCFYEPIHLSCESNRKFVLLFEEEQQRDETMSKMCITNIPCVDDPTTLESWDGSSQSVAVSEIMFYLLQWNFTHTREAWVTYP
jgi:hypothetical protein